MTTTTTISDAKPEAGDWESAPLSDLIDHIVETHHVFLRAHLPKLGERLERLMRKSPETRCDFVAPLHDTFFDLKNELDAHLLKEERILFPMITQMEEARAAGAEPPPNHCGTVQAPIRQMEHEHANGKKALAGMRALTNGYPIEEGMCNGRRGLFEDLLALEADLFEHMRLENEILHPRAAELEK